MSNDDKRKLGELDRRAMIKAGLAAGAGAAFSPTIASVASAATGSGPACYTVGCVPGPMDLCFIGDVPGAGGNNVDVRFTFVAECYAGPGVNCPVTATAVVDILDQPNCIVAPLCVAVPASCFPGGANCDCPPFPPTVDAYVLAMLIEFRVTGMPTVIFSCTPGKKRGCDCVNTTCP